MKFVSIVAIAAAMMVSGGAFAADLQIPAQPDKAMAYATSGWDGFYVGVNAGYGSADRSGTWQSLGAPVNFNYNLSGGLIGAQAGFNYTLGNNFVVGLQVDADAGNITGTLDPTGPDAGQGTYNWLTTATAKLGYATDKFLVYVDGGYALAGLNFNGVLGCNFNQTDSGFTAGAGASYKMTDNVSVDLNYSHVWFQNATASCSSFGVLPVAVTDTAPSADIIKLGVNYKFGG